MAAVAREVRERLRHEGGDHPALLGEDVDHVAEEDRTVTAREGVRVGEVLLELAVRVLVIVRVVAPAELVHVRRDRRQELEVPGESDQVVAGLLQRVHAVGELDRVVVSLLDEEILELEAHLELAAENRPRVVRPLLSVHVNVAGEARNGLVPRQRCESRGVGDGRNVRIARDLADLAGCEPGEARALAEEVVQIRGWYELGARECIHVNELREEELDLALLHLVAYLIEAGHAELLPRSGSPRTYRDGEGAPMAAFYKGKRPFMWTATGLALPEA